MKKRDTIWYMCIILIIVFFIWGIIDYIFGNVDLVGDRLYIILISLLCIFTYKKLRISKTVAYFGLIPIFLHAWGNYNAVWFNIPFDHVLHFTAGIVIGMIFYNYLQLKHSKFTAAILALCITAGIGSFLEIIEFLGYIFGGEGRGIFYYGAGDVGEWSNSIKDMIMNTFGAIVGIISSIFSKRLK